jgi:hypothetical protein
MGSTILEVVLGAVVAILITILVENLRKPRLQLSIDSPPTDVSYQNHPAQHARFLAVRLANRPLPRWARWMSRNTALQCHGEITFHHLDGQNVFGRAMTGRWSGSPEPVTINFRIDKHFVSFSDPSKLTSTVDVPPGETRVLDIAARFDDDEDCYGWNNEAYSSDPVWRNPDWCLSPDRYLVRVTIVSAGEKCIRLFRLINDVSRSDFRLERTLPNDVVTN